MSSTDHHPVAGPGPAPAFRHEALFYAGRRGFLAGTVPFIQEGLARDEPVLVVVDTAKIAALRAELGADADRVHFADMAEVGRNPARIIPRWQGFVAEHLRADRPVRGIGEPIWAGRSPAELVECQVHETLLNIAFAPGPAWTLLCPYDVAALEQAVLAEARRSHPFVVRDGGHEASGDYLDPHPSPMRLDEPLPPPPADTEALAFGPALTDLAVVRATVRRYAELVGLDPVRTEHAILAANELATNSLRHGSGRGTALLWCEGDTLVCEIRDAGRFTAPPLLGREHPDLRQVGGRGLWLVNQVCDLVQIRSTPAGTAVRVRIRAGDGSGLVPGRPSGDGDPVSGPASGLGATGPGRGSPGTGNPAGGPTG